MNKAEIYDKILNDFGGDSLAADVLIDKYLLKDKDGDIKETCADDMHHRLAKEFARIELNYPYPILEEDIFNLFKDFKYIIPGGSPMAGIGNNYGITSLSNCFVIGNDADSYGGIMKTDEEQVQIMKRRGGVGHDLSHLRPQNSFANNVVLKGLTGCSSYANRFSNSTREVRQGDRRGALMLTLDMRHPDAENFIDLKTKEGNITDANLSIKITDKFMDAVVNDYDFIQTFPIDMPDSAFVSEFPCNESDLPYNELVDGISGKVYCKKIKAKKLWNKIVLNSWKYAEPGILFWDNIIKESPADCYKVEGFETVSTNPCSEIPLCQYDSCRLMAINLYFYVVNPFQIDSYFDYNLFSEHVRIAQRLMDDLIDLEVEKINKILNKIKSDSESFTYKEVEMTLWGKILDKTKRGRRTGLGITAEGDMIAAMGLRYGSEESIELSGNVHKMLAKNSYMSSIDLAKERGSFPIWDVNKEKENPFIKRIIPELDLVYKQRYKKYGRRNIANLTVAPTGTISILTQTTSGIEPCFNILYKRRKRTYDKSKAVIIENNGDMFEEYKVFHSKFKVWYNLNWFKLDSKYFDIDFKKPIENYSDEDLKILISKSPYYKSTASDVNWVNKVRLQGEVQRFVDHGISATTNVPKDTPVELIDTIYKTAYNYGCKGMTIYREGSRSGILVNENKLDYIDAVKRKKILNCDIFHKTALKQNWMVVVGLQNDKPYEIFALKEPDSKVFDFTITKGIITKIKSGVYRLSGILDGKEFVIPNIINYIDQTHQVDTRKFSIMLRHNIDPKWIVSDIEQYAIITSFDKVVQRVLNKYLVSEKEISEVCSECGGKLSNENGCVICLSCGWSKCS